MPSRCVIAGLLSLTFLSLVGRADSVSGRVGVYRNDGGQWTAEQVDRLTNRLRGVGLEVSTPDARQLIDPSVVTPERFDLLVICDAARVPAAAVSTIARFSRAGGKLMLLGGPFFEQATWPYGDRWLDRETLRQVVVKEMRPSVVFDFDVDSDFGSDASNRWRHHSAFVKPGLAYG
jgi:hypothetical protein